MSLPLKDLRVKITAETDCWLDAVARVSNRDKSEVVRELLHKWASEQERISKLALNSMEREGLLGRHRD